MTKTRKHKKTHNKTSKRVFIDSESVWGKNKPLEKFWQELASGRQVVVVYKNGKHKYVKVPKSSADFYNELDDNKEIDVVLSSNQSQDAYEIYLYPKAKNNSVEYVIKNHKKYFKSMGPNMTSMVKVRVPS